MGIEASQTNMEAVLIWGALIVGLVFAVVEQCQWNADAKSGNWKRQ